MQWRNESASSRQYNWKEAWWDHEARLNIDGQLAFVMTLRGKEGFFICTYVGTPCEYEPHHGPFETLELAQFTYELVAGDVP